MRGVTCSMRVSLDGCIVGPDGDFGWTAPDDEVFGSVTAEFRKVGVHLLGRYPCHRTLAGLRLPPPAAAR